jgi:hypothetical protein
MESVGIVGPQERHHLSLVEVSHPGKEVKETVGMADRSGVIHINHEPGDASTTHTASCICGHRKHKTENAEG